jgi:hypothetical protein
VLKINSVERGKQWLERETLLYKKQVKTITLMGARVLIKENLGYLAARFFTQKEVDHLKRILGVTKKVFG